MFRFKDYIETSEFNFWNIKKNPSDLILNNNFTNNGVYCSFTPPIDAENYAILEKFMQNNIENPKFFFEELFPLLKFSNTFFIFMYNTNDKKNLILENCKALVIVFEEDDGGLDCYTFSINSIRDIENTSESIIFFINESIETGRRITIHDNTETGSFKECITRMKDNAITKGVYFPSGFSKLIPTEHYINEQRFYHDRLSRIIARNTSGVENDEKNFTNFFLILFSLRFPGQLHCLENLVFNVSTRGVVTMNLGEILWKTSSLHINTNPDLNVRFLVCIMHLEYFENKRKIGSHESKLLIDRKFKKVVYIEPMFKDNENTYEQINNLTKDYLKNKKIIDITDFTITQSIISTNEKEYVQYMFESAEIKYENYCVFISWWMLFIILKLNEYNQQSFYQIAGDSLNEVVKENPHFIGYFFYVVEKLIQTPEYKNGNYNFKTNYIKNEFLIQNLLDPTKPASPFGVDNNIID